MPGSALLKQDEHHDGWKECGGILIALVFHPPVEAANKLYPLRAACRHRGLEAHLDKLIDLQYEWCHVFQATIDGGCEASSSHRLSILICTVHVAHEEVSECREDLH